MRKHKRNHGRERVCIPDTELSRFIQGEKKVNGSLERSSVLNI